jgi:hypothetical protein
MIGKWSHFHTIYEVMVGVNLALFTFPALRQPHLNDEAGKWATLLRLIPHSDRRYEEVHRVANEFESARRDIEHRTSAVQTYCAWVAVLCLATLIWATAAADDDANPIAAWGVVSLSLTPATILFGLNGEAGRKINLFSTTRSHIERGLVQ